MADLPRWVWDVLADLVEFEDVHGRDERCLRSTVERVPAEIWRGAEVVRAYREFEKGLLAADVAPHVDRKPA